MASSINDFTTGNIRSALIRFSLPFFLTNLIQSLYNIADIMVVGHFCGSGGIAGASIGGSVTMTITYMIIGLCNGGAIMTAQYAGRKSESDIRETIVHAYAAARRGIYRSDVAHDGSYSCRAQHARGGVCRDKGIFQDMYDGLGIHLRI